MNWQAAVDGYCERIGPELWAEPMNAVTNLAFLIAAYIMARRLRGTDLPLAWVLVWLLAAIGVGSFLFHTVAQVWAGVFDVLPIVVFALLYIYAANREFWGLSRLVSLIGTILFIPFAVLVSPLFQPLIGGSAVYAPLPVLIFAYALALWHRAPRTAAGLAIGVVLLSVSIWMRALDAPFCDGWPLGTHFVWHLLNALMLALMIEVYRAHGVARRATER